MDQYSIPWSSNIVTGKSVPSGPAFEVGLNSRVPYPSPFLWGGWFFIEASFLVGGIDGDQFFGHRAEKTPKGRPLAKVGTHKTHVQGITLLR
jgi:hypothetical protein